MSPEEAAAICRLMDPPPKYEPLRRYIAVYRINGELRLSEIAFTNQIAAWTKPRGPNVPRDIELVDVIDVKYPAACESSHPGLAPPSGRVTDGGCIASGDVSAVDFSEAAIKEILTQHFCTGEPGERDAIKAAAQILAALMPVSCAP